MRAGKCLMYAAMVATMAGTARAQDSAPPPAAAPAPAQRPATTAPVLVGGIRNHWLGSGFVGTNFGKSASDPSTDFGGQVAYLWHGLVGGEVLGDFAPEFKMNNPFFAENPNVGAYMANVIGALPLGSDGRFAPYASGGLGAVHLQSTFINTFQPEVNPHDASAAGTSSGNQMQLGSNVGGGLMVFTGKLGVRADIRYYKTSATNSLTTANTPADELTQRLLSELQFWRGNVGIAFRF